MAWHQQATIPARQGWGVLERMFREFVDDDCPRMAAALSYYTVFALPPLLVIVILVTGMVLSPQQVEGWIQGQVGSLIGAGAADQIQTMIASAEQRVQGDFSLGLILGIAGLIFGATGAFVQLQDALNKAWEVEPDPAQGGLRKFAVKRLFSLGMILVIAFLLLVSLVVSSLISTFSDELGAVLPGGLSTVMVWTLNTGISLAVITLLFAAIFKVLPDAEISWRDVWVGAFVTALLFVLGKFLISLYIGHSDPSQVYGAAAALALILVWVYYSTMILFLGAEFTQVWSQRFGKGIRPQPGAVHVIEEKKRLSEPPAQE